MFDTMMFWIYSFATSYHSLRGGGLTKFESVKGAYKTISESEVAKSVEEFQKNMWAATKQIVEERNMK